MTGCLAVWVCLGSLEVVARYKPVLSDQSLTKFIGNRIIIYNKIYF
jgi:hypothetical protein